MHNGRMNLKVLTGILIAIVGFAVAFLWASNSNLSHETLLTVALVFSSSIYLINFLVKLMIKKKNGL
jgi:hypothetical protein